MLELERSLVWDWEQVWNYLNYIGMKKARKQGDFRLELLFKQSSGLLILVWNPHHFHGNCSLLVNSSVNSTVRPGSELVSDEELGKISSPFLLIVLWNLPVVQIFRIQYHGPWFQAVKSPPLHDLHIRIRLGFRRGREWLRFALRFSKAKTVEKRGRHWSSALELDFSTLRSPLPSNAL